MVSQRKTHRYFTVAFIVTALGLVGAYLLGWWTRGTAAGGISFLIVGSILAILEISLSFDNAVVNANRLATMSEVWRKRFLTWGILIAVFGMRILFPLVVVAVAAKVNPFAAFSLALTHPQTYSHMMHEAHLPIAAFGGSFLAMVGLDYFIDSGKEVHWIKRVESFLSRLGSIEGFQYTIVLALVAGFALFHEGEDRALFLFASVFGLLVFAAVNVLGNILDQQSQADALARNGGLGAFLYLEVLDASFSFDGVIGAFALTQHLVLIAIGLGIGAMYVRSMTIMLVEKEALNEYCYLEHGAFWSILILAIVMFVQTLSPVPEMVTGLVGAGLIGLAFLSSVRRNRRDRRQAGPISATGAPSSR